MKKISFALLSAFYLCLLAACSDDLTDVGASVRSEKDGIAIKYDNFEIPIQTVYRDSVYVRTGYPLLGTLTDPAYGEMSASYLAQFYANKETGLTIRNSDDSITFDILRTSVPASLGYDWPDYHYTPWDSICNNMLDSMTVRIYYQSYYGDSLTPMQVSVFSLDSDADFSNLPQSEFYSNNDFSKLYTADNAHLLGRKAYTVANREVSDSLRQTDDYMNYIEVRLDEKYKNDFFRMCVEAAISRDNNNPHHNDYKDVFSDENELRKSWLSGVCIKPTFGDGAIIKVYYTAIYFFYSSHHRFNVDGTLLRTENDDADSTYNQTHVEYIAVTPDVIQMSGIKYKDEYVTERTSDPEATYISSPQGYYTKLDMPIGKLINHVYSDPLRNDSSFFFNAANFYLKAYKPEGYLLSSKPAPTLLLVHNDSVNTFFEEGSLPSSTTSCYASYSCDSVPKTTYNDPTQGIYYYSFGNIASVIKGLAVSEGWKQSELNSVEAWATRLKQSGKLAQDKTIDDYTIPMALIPVDVTTNSTHGTLLSISNYILPTSVRLKKNEQHLQLIYTLEGATK